MGMKYAERLCKESRWSKATCTFIIPPQTLFVVGYTVFTLSMCACVCACVRRSVRPSVRNVFFF